ncbi:MAG: NUDIX domain-containing protein [Enhygromyxa sp.]
MAHHGVGVLVTNHARTRFCVQQKDRDYTPHPRGYSLFGGALDPGEDPAEGLARELHEELGAAAAERLIAAGLRAVLTTTVEPFGFVYSLFEVAIDDPLLDRLAAAPVLEGERAAVVEREQLLSLPFIWGLEAVLAAYLEAR